MHALIEIERGAIRTANCLLLIQAVQLKRISVSNLHSTLLSILNRTLPVGLRVAVEDWCRYVEGQTNMCCLVSMCGLETTWVGAEVAKSVEQVR